jgi:hypothetical protein
MPDKAETEIYLQLSLTGGIKKNNLAPYAASLMHLIRSAFIKGDRHIVKFKKYYFHFHPFL